MSNHLKKLLALLLCLVMILGMLPTVAFASSGKAKKEVSSEGIWETINKIEDEKVIATRGRKATADDYAAIVDDVIAAVEASDSYKEGTIERHGDFFFWETEDGEPQGYSPRLRAQIHSTSNPDATAEDFEGKTETVSFAVRGGSPSSKNVAVFQPYYGIDNSFTTQYKTEGESIAAATGGTCTTYLTTNATITNIGNALSNCGVVIFDSHGDTDYYVSGSDDYVTQANTSYLCLQSNTGWTTADQASATGTYGTYYHAYNAGSNGNMHYYCFDGTAMANHMSSTNPNNLVWMAICLGMATTGLHAPLRNAGVGVVYGYSQSTSFDGDYEYEADFWTKMKNGDNVATAFAYMTRTYKWDPAYASTSSYNTIGKARYNYCAFPNIVSAEDTYQGHRTTNPSSATAANSTAYNSAYGACNLQTVNSTWTLFTQYEVTAVSNNTSYGTVSVSGTTITASPATGYYAAGYTVTSGTASVVQNGNTFDVSPSSDCTIRINFAAKTPVTLTYMANGSTYNTATGYAGEALSLPGTAPAVTGYTFAGWSTSTFGDTTTKPSFYTPGASFTPSANTTLYAVYTQTVGGTTSEVTDTLTSAQTGITTSSYSSFTYTGTSGAVYEGYVAGSNSYIQMNVKNNNVGIVTTTSPGTIKSVTLTFTNNSSNTLNVYGSTSAYSGSAALYGSSTGTLIDGVSSDGTITVSGDYQHIGFKSNGGAIYLASIAITWTVGTGTVHYTTSPFVCNHDNVTAHAAVAATCTNNGNNAYWSCDTCGALFSDSAHTTSTTLDAVTTTALGHNYGAWTSNNDGTHSKTCSRCSDVETEDCTFTTSTSGATVTHTCSVCSYSYTTQLATYTVTYNDRGTTSSVSCVEGNSVTLPASGTEVDGYDFVGWVSAAIPDETTTSPTVLTGSYWPEENVTLYALYSRSETGGDTGVTGYALASGDINVGDKLIVALKDGDNYYALPNANKSSGASISGTPLTVTGTLATDSSSITFEVIKNSGYVGLKSTEASNYLGLNSNAIACNGWGNTKYLTFTEVGSGLYTITSSNNSGRGLTTSGTSFTCSNSSADNVYIFRYTEGGAVTTLYYTTNPISASSCEHTSVTHNNRVDATCTTAGSIEYWECDSCHTLWNSSDKADGHKITADTITITALGHNLVAGTPVAATCTTAGYTPNTCSRCGATENSNPVAALGHSWGDWTVTAEPTASANGSRTRSCTRAGCSASETETISNEAAVTGYNLTTNGDVLVNSYISVPQYMIDDDAGMYVTIGDGDHILLSSITTTADANGNVKTDNGFKFPYTVPAKNMQDTVTLKLYQSDGTQVELEGATDADGGVTYSVQGYINQVLADAATYEAAYPGVTALCKAMSAYGSYAQVQQNYTTSNGAAYNPVSVDSTTAKEINNIGTSSLTNGATVSTTTNSIEGLSFYGASLIMMSKMTLRFYFTYTGSGTLTSNSVALGRNGDYYYVDVTGIAAKDFSVGQTVTVTDGTNSCTVSGYSVNRYVYKVLTASSVNSNMLTLAKAIAYYGIKATAYYTNNNS